ncbi:hypothetical protein DFH09DRAFT_1364842 [Mycena vulgaris]|nr:hypothetical protein DFH09DRAFT_1364842 [Mycena vulgaris]
MASGSSPMSYFEELTANSRRKLFNSLNHETGYTRTVAVSSLRWHQMDESRDQVVSVEAVAQARAAMERHIQDPDENPEPEPLSPFIFSMIVLITPADFFAMPCARWNGPTDLAPTFAHAKMTFTGKAPENNLPLERDFHAAHSTLEKICKLTQTSDAHTRQGLFAPLCNVPKLRFTHRPFEKVEQGGEDNDDEVPPEFTIGQWPVISGEARKALAEMKSTHRAIRLVAYDVHGYIIPPSHYETQLPGALVQIKFTLSHWNIKQKASDVFCADIWHIRILVPSLPTLPPSSPSKRKLNLKDEESGDILPKKARLEPFV